MSIETVHFLYLSEFSQPTSGTARRGGRFFVRKPRSHSQRTGQVCGVDVLKYLIRTQTISAGVTARPEAVTSAPRSSNQQLEVRPPSSQGGADPVTASSLEGWESVLQSVKYKSKPRRGGALLEPEGRAMIKEETPTRLEDARKGLDSACLTKRSWAKMNQSSLSRVMTSMTANFPRRRD